MPSWCLIYPTDPRSRRQFDSLSIGSDRWQLHLKRPRQSVNRRRPATAVAAGGDSYKPRPRDALLCKFNDVAGTVYTRMLRLPPARVHLINRATFRNVSLIKRAGDLRPCRGPLTKTHGRELSSRSLVRLRGEERDMLISAVSLCGKLKFSVFFFLFFF